MTKRFMFMIPAGKGKIILFIHERSLNFVFIQKCLFNVCMIKRVIKGITSTIFFFLVLQVEK